MVERVPLVSLTIDVNVEGSVRSWWSLEGIRWRKDDEPESGDSGGVNEVSDDDSLNSTRTGIPSLASRFHDQH